MNSVSGDDLFDERLGRRLDSFKQDEGEVRKMENGNQEIKEQAPTDDLNTPIGTKETIALQPAIVQVMVVEIETIGKKDSKKIVCTCKHPSKDEPIKISGVKYENKGKLDVAGLWVNKDGDGNLRKDSALAALMIKLNATTPQGINGKDIETVLDSAGYLVFKGY